MNDRETGLAPPPSSSHQGENHARKKAEEKLLFLRFPVKECN